MAISSANSSNENTKGSGNTECICFIHTHDRGPSYPSQKIDISQYIVSVGISQDLAGGGAASINLPAIDYIEDILAAGDIINIYFNLNRADVDIYSIGRVRTFFGYIESITKIISVGGMGEKMTSYTISAKDFSKAIRATEVYNNPHLSSQSRGGKKDVIRKDAASNLGGIALLTAGIALVGTPRQVIIQNLMRILGFGGQYALPSSYMEKLPKSSTSLGIKKDKGKESWANTIQGAKRSILNTEDAKVKKEFADILYLLAKDSAKTGGKKVSAAWDAVTTTGAYSVGLEKRIQVIKNKFRFTEINLDLKGRGRPYVNNTFFKIRGLKKDSKNPRGMRSIKPDVLVNKAEQGLEYDLERVTKMVVNEIIAFNNDVINDFGSFVKANQYAQGWSGTAGDAYKTDVVTIFNILCLDYLEKVGGYWPGMTSMNYQGSLLALLEEGANMSMNELFFDLRPSPEFTPLNKDGLGTSLGGALPMVPAVVLRLKPFTNYSNPSSEITNDQLSGSLVMGGIRAAGKDAKSLVYTDQLVINSGGALGTYGAEAIKSTRASKAKVGASLDKVSTSGPEPSTTITDVPLQKIKPKKGAGRTDPPASKKGKKAPTSKAKKKYQSELDKINKLVSDGVVTSDDLVKMYEKALATPGGGGDEGTKSEFIGIETTTGNLRVDRKNFSTLVTLPRPVFRSPDNSRITKELNLSFKQYILGVQVPRGPGLEGTKFSAFGVADGDSGVGLKKISPDTGFTPVGGAEKGDKALFQDGSSMFDINQRLKTANSKLDEPDSKNIDYHVLDYCVIYNEDCVSESYSRGDFGLVNFLEYWGNTVGDVNAQRLFLGTVMPIITPVSVYRFGIRVLTQSTKHVQALLTGEVDHDHQKNVLLRWVVLQDMWNQHNHELLSGSVSLRGLPGIRVGYRIDRPELNLSFYVEGVSHNWTFPGQLITQLRVSRGQPMGSLNALPYRRPRASEDPATVDRQELGRVFQTGSFKKKRGGLIAGERTHNLDIPGTYTGADGVGRQIKVERREKNPKPPTAPPPKKTE